MLRPPFRPPSTPVHRSDLRKRLSECIIRPGELYLLKYGSSKQHSRKEKHRTPGELASFQGRRFRSDDRHRGRFPLPVLHHRHVSACMTVSDQEAAELAEAILERNSRLGTVTLDRHRNGVACAWGPGIMWRISMARAADGLVGMWEGVPAPVMPPEYELLAQVLRHAPSFPTAACRDLPPQVMDGGLTRGCSNSLGRVRRVPGSTPVPRLGHPPGRSGP